ncbi:MAG: DUF2339 domain-containing protein [Flavobacteriaceae bacterium]|nr:DUF2339 domain-containing protein [Flavobacteriaceae bacterium]
MENEIAAIALLIIIALIVVPIILLVKISSINDHINTIEFQLKTLLHISATKQDIKEIFEAADKVTDKTQVTPKTVKLEDIPLIAPISSPKETIKEETVIEKPSNVVEGIQPEKEKTEITPPESVIRRYADIYESKSIHSVKAQPFSEPVQPIQRSVQPKKEDIRERSFVERLGDNWLSKVGIITLVLGIGFFVKYAIDQNWINEVSRVGIGLLIGGIIIVTANRLKSNYHVFSSILTGGGISVFYITITLAFREYELFNQTLAFIFLIAITAFSVILSLLYDRKELAIFSLLGGFASPLMVSSGSGNYIVLFSYILILNSGMLFVSFRKKWRIIGIISYVLTLIFFLSWLLYSYKSEFKGAALFSVLFFIQFYLLALIDHFKSENKISAYQASLILTNNLFLFSSCLYIFNNYLYDIRGIITISMAVINAVILAVLFNKSKIDRNLIYLLIAVVMSFVSLVIPIQLNGHVITMFWAAEVVLLLWLWQKSRINVFRIGFLIILLPVIISYIMDIYHNYSYVEVLPIVFNRIFITGLVIIASFVVSLYLLEKEDRKEIIKIKNVSFWSVGSIINVFKLSIVVLAFIVPFLELNYQLTLYTDNYSLYTDNISSFRVAPYADISSFRYVALAAYTAIYIAVLAIVYKNRIKTNKLIFGLLVTTVFLYALFYSYLSINLRFDIFYMNRYPTAYFLIHFLGLPAVITVLYFLIKNTNSSSDNFSLFCWSMITLSVIILSVETDHMVILLSGNNENYDLLLYNVHTFGYPILWGLIAMVLMIWGLKQKEVLLRKISLIFFGIIIVKFYAYDVWYMSQGGRILSFVLLGVILLLVSFLQQKIKTLVKEDIPKAENQEDISNEMQS